MADWSFRLYPEDANDSTTTVQVTVQPSMSTRFVDLKLTKNDDTFMIRLHADEANLLAGALIDAAREAP